MSAGLIRLCIVLVALGAPSAAQASRCARPEEVVEIGVQRSDGTKIRPRGQHLTPTQRWRPRKPKDRTARYVRLRIQRTNLEAGGWRLSIRSQELRLLQAIGPDEFSGRIVWTGRIPFREGESNPWVALDLELGEDESNPGLSVKGYHAMPSQALRPFYSATPGSREVDLFEDGNADWKIRGDSVGLLLANYDKDSWCCTGVFLTEDLLLTNWHCGGVPRVGDVGLVDSLFWSARVCESIVVDTSWDRDPVSREFVPEATTPCTVSNNLDLDYALLRMRPRSSNGPMRPAEIRLGEEVADKEPLTLLHHAGCRPKRLSDLCSVKAVDHSSWRDDVVDIDFGHTCNTELGSSGAPVFDRQGRIVGLHHLGFEWNSDCTDSDKLNKAVKIGTILKDLPRSTCLEIVGESGAAACEDESF